MKIKFHLPSSSIEQILMELNKLSGSHREKTGKLAETEGESQREKGRARNLESVYGEFGRGRKSNI